MRSVQGILFHLFVVATSLLVFAALLTVVDLDRGGRDQCVPAHIYDLACIGD